MDSFFKLPDVLLLIDGRASAVESSNPLIGFIFDDDGSIR